MRRRSRKAYMKTRTSPFDKCAYCNKSIVWRELLKFPVVQKTQKKIVWLVGKKPVGMATATIDHVLPIVEGGDGAVSNLVGSCVECNVKQGRKAPLT